MSPWQGYAQLAGDTGIVAYATGPDSIAIEFRDGARYLYTADSSGGDNVQRMKQLAARGIGLTTFVNQHVRQAYERKLR